MQVVSDICVDMMDRLANEANHFRRKSEMETLRVDHLICAVKTLFTTKDLRIHALSFGARRTTQLMDALWEHRYVTPAPAEAPAAGGTAPASP
jgi:hypothetical protein